MKNKYLERAAKEALTEPLGYEESKVYYLLLTHQEGEIDDKFSHSKKYRLMKDLFENGAMGKVKGEQRDSYTYILLPLSFLYLNNINKEIIEYLEKEYMKNHADKLLKEFTHLVLKDCSGLLYFLLKYHMKQEASLILDGLDIDFIDRKKVNVIDNDKNNKKNIGIIDGLAFELSNIPDNNSYSYIGYLGKGDKYISRVREILGKEILGK